jgi:hypothetical protein
MELRAHLGGVVVEVSADAVTLEGRAVAIRGVAGAGPATSGPLALLVTGGQVPVDARSPVLDVGSSHAINTTPNPQSPIPNPEANDPRPPAAGAPLPSGAIVATCRRLLWEDVVQLAGRGAAGIIAPAASHEVWVRMGVLPAAGAALARRGGLAEWLARPPVTLVLTDELPMPAGDALPLSPALWAELEPCAGQPASVLGHEHAAPPELLLPADGTPIVAGGDQSKDGGVQQQDGGVQPEQHGDDSATSSPLPAANPPPPPADAPWPHHVSRLSAGAFVRVTAGARAGATGRVLALSPRPRRFPSEILAHAARLDLDGVGEYWVPLVNVELIDRLTH